MSEQLAHLLRRMVQEGEISQETFGQSGMSPEELGLVVKNGVVGLPEEGVLLDEDEIRAAATPAAAAWLRELSIFLAVDSTNSRMMQAAQERPVEGCAWFAELQFAGRGRRGRRWVTPFGRNIAVTLGFGLGLPVTGLGGLSLAIGLAVAGYLRSEGVDQAAVKWPNDVYIGNAKVCGILIEVAVPLGAPPASPMTVVNRPEGGVRNQLPHWWGMSGRCDCIVGIGLNLDLPQVARAAIDQEVTDLKAQGIHIDRNQAAGALISAVVEAVKKFEQEGFAQMRAAYDSLHLCHGRPCRVVQDGHSYEGVVLGVTNTGALRVRCVTGDKEFIGGEVSLRLSSGQ